MKLLFGLVVLVATYMFVLMHTTSAVLGQTNQLQTVYQQVANTDPETLATGRTTTP